MQNSTRTSKRSSTFPARLPPALVPELPALKRTRALPCPPMDAANGEARSLPWECPQRFPLSSSGLPPYTDRGTGAFSHCSSFSHGAFNHALPEGASASVSVTWRTAVRGLLLVAEKEEARGEIFFLSDGKDYGWKEIGDAFARAAGRRATRDFTVPESFIRTYAAIADMVATVRRRPALLNSDKVKEMVQPGWVCDNGKSRRLLGF